jgi:glycyl-radical enzyme activating protein
MKGLRTDMAISENKTDTAVSVDKQVKGTLFDIQRFCLHDGPGIRTNIFFKGCPLRCVWCHNPESYRKQKELIYRAHKCQGCRACERVCPNGAHKFDRNIHIVEFEKCAQCGMCLEVCCYEAVSILGYEMTVDEVIDSVRTDLPYYRSGGGVTFTGGEPMMQPKFAIQLAEALKKEGIHLCIETCGFTNSEYFEQIMPYVDCFLYDYKATDDVLHKKLTGVSNRLILKNLELINSSGKEIILRCPLIPGINDSDEHLAGIAGIFKRHDMIKRVEVMPYHRMGETKRIQLGCNAALPDIKEASEEEKGKWLQKLRNLGCNAIII